MALKIPILIFIFSVRCYEAHKPFHSLISPLLPVTHDLQYFMTESSELEFYPVW